MFTYPCHAPAPSLNTAGLQRLRVRRVSCFQQAPGWTTTCITMSVGMMVGWDCHSFSWGLNPRPAADSAGVLQTKLYVEAPVAFFTLQPYILIHRCTRLPCAGTWLRNQELLNLPACRRGSGCMFLLAPTYTSTSIDARVSHALGHGSNVKSCHGSLSTAALYVTLGPRRA
jgi:hypothetical protein